MPKQKQSLVPDLRADLEVCYEGEAAVLYYHRRSKILHHQLRRFIHGSEFRQLLEAGLSVLASRRACKWLSDDRLNGPVTVADEEWSKKYWTPRALAAGWKYWAIVFPEKVLGQMNMRRWIEAHAAVGLVAQGFADPDEALRWLERQQ